MEIPATRHLVLVGGGHAHVAVLKAFAMRPEPGLRVSVVSPYSYATYSGMVPGVLSGAYALKEAQIDVRALAARARAAFHADHIVRIDSSSSRLELAGRPPVTYDLLSLDIGSVPYGTDRILATGQVLPVKPIEVAANGIQSALASPAPPEGRQVIVVGAGAGGVEIAFALASRLRGEGSGSVTLCDRSARPLGERDARTARLVERALALHGIVFIGGAEVDQVDDRGVQLAGGRILAADLVVWATGAAGPPLLAQSGLPVDQRGFLLVGDDLRCVDHPEIFAAGDCATLRSHPHLAKAGVYAVRQGPVLAVNLRLASRGVERLQVFRPQKRFLSLLNTGDGLAILSYGKLAAQRRWAWKLKDRIDRAFIDKYALPAPEERESMGGEMIACGGCAAKAGSDVLASVLQKLDLPTSEGLLIGIPEADDAAVFANPPGSHSVATIDAFPPFSDDFFLVGQVAAVNAASDLYAMGAEGSAAIALVCLSAADAREQEVQLEHYLQGALDSLRRMGIPLAGGHTIAGEQSLMGFAMHGWVEAGRALRKAGARPGDRLVLTKPLGTGVLLAAARAGFAAAEWVEAAHGSMLRSNGPAMRILRQHGVRACTDVTGFGLGGHLTEVLRASGVGARLSLERIPTLPGAMDLLAAGWRSSFHPVNERAQRARPFVETSHGTEATILSDPQTSGGLLAAIPPENVAALGTAAAEAGEAFTVIGEVVTGDPVWQLQ